MNKTKPIENDFPISGLLPKNETGAASFLTKYPTYDGRGIVIAILDSGVDPGAPGLQKTSDGKIKVIERFDCSGCGDVDTKTIVEPDDEGYITGLTGRKMRIPNNWNNPSGTFRIGVKNAFDLYPERLRDRVKGEYKKKNWKEGQRNVLSNLWRDLSQLEDKQKKTLNETEKLLKEDCEAKVEFLNNLDKKYCDNGPVFDCILYNDGSKWMCCVNVSSENDLSKCPLLGEYSVTHEYLPLTKIDNLNFSFNVHDDGNVLELVGVCSSHGTHVASIASSYFPDLPEQNGLAPGAQVISLTIGDGRLGSMETGTALIRAMIKIIELKKKMNIHVINMSYGEHAHWVDTGRVGNLVNEIVNKYGIIWVSSAGNSGPALGTISTPSDIADEPIISVGAYVSSEMMVAEYAMREKLPGSTYTWSSRGPTIDGGVGVHVCAPGGAITSVPNFTLRYSQLMNGTSMASPNCAGAICLLLSGMVQQELPFSPYLVRRALENTASFIEGLEIPAQGAGLIQVEKAFEYLVNYHNTQERDVRFQVQCGSSNSKGIYLRTKLNTTKHTYKVSIEPKFLNEDEVLPEKKINFNIKLVMTSPSSFVQFPKYLDLSNMARMFAVKIDTSDLSEGLYSTFINVCDSTCIAKGPIFKIPITVIQPKEITESKFKVVYNDVAFKPNTIKRHYYAVPPCASWAVLTLTSVEDTGRFIVHTMQCLPRQHCKALETMKNIPVTSKNETSISFQVKEDNVLELVIAKYWASTGDMKLNYSLAFFGIKPNQPMINMYSSNGIHMVEVRTLQGEEVNPVITLKNSVQVLKPSENKLSPLTKRDVIPPSRQIYELVLSYNFSITKACEVSPNLPLLSDMLYESEYESQFWMIFDCNKQLLGSGDAYPSKYTVKLEKGDYVIRLQVRHDKKAYLEKIQEAPLLLQQKLSTNIIMDIYLSYSQALIGGKKAGVIQDSNPYYVQPLYIAPLNADKFSIKSNNPAHYLTGTITYGKDDFCKKVDIYPIKYFLPVHNLLGANSSKKNTDNGLPERPKIEEYRDCLRDFEINWLPKFDKETGEKVYEELAKTYPNHLPLHLSFLQLIDPLDRKVLPTLKRKLTQNAGDVRKVINICEKVLENVNEESILEFLATKTDLRPDAVKHKTHMEQQKNVYLESLIRKGIALCKLHVLNEAPENIMDEISTVWKSMVKFVDPNDLKVLTSHALYFATWHAFVKKQYGRVLKYLFKLQEDKPSEDVDKKIIEFCEMLQWKHVVDYLERNLPSRYPNSYRPF
ncbi:tripeptidyl-peptidase 2 isoform X2 [Anthonomus grandis grandis]|uniref:tripeptidyl-peptidase 2 isoform X2 n=1 Tax=Anthonomus grandis grandis TaxID=2921223 RepID=UPI0021660D8B|nr:tripeptidyl-peptidase 2 isoform X2 [Anthonomus grandis grandis]